MLEKIGNRRWVLLLSPRSAWAVLALVLVLGLGVAHPTAQELSDEQIAGSLEAVILEQTRTPTRVETVVEIPVSQDTYISSNHPDTNYGGAGELRLGYNLAGDHDGALRPFARFDVAAHVPSGAVIRSASLWAYLFASSPLDDAPMGTNDRHLLSSWDEDLVTWNSHQPNWGSVFGAADVTDALGWHEWDVLELVRDWHQGTHPNYGLIVIGDEHVQERQRVFYSMNANNDRYPRLVVEYVVSTDTTAPTASVDPLPAWSPSTFPVSWGGSDTGGSGIAYFDVQFSANSSPWENWQVHTTATSAQFVGGGNGIFYRFRARAVDHAGNVQPFDSSQAQTKVDALPPYVSVDPLPDYTFVSAFGVSWSGSDNPEGSGVAVYDVQYRKADGAWRYWLVRTSATGAQFTGAEDGTTYGFRARGIDVAGNVQPYPETPQAVIRAETSGPTASIEAFRPIVTGEDSFLVKWTGSTAPPLSILYFDVRYRFNDGPWIAWLTETTLTSAVFSDLNAQDGLYGFEVRAKDSADRLEPFSGEAEASIIVDRLAPFIEPQSYLPVVFR